MGTYPVIINKRLRPDERTHDNHTHIPQDYRTPSSQRYARYLQAKIAKRQPSGHRKGRY